MLSTALSTVVLGMQPQLVPAINIFTPEARVTLQGNDDFLAGLPQSEDLATTLDTLHGDVRRTTRERASRRQLASARRGRHSRQRGSPE